MGHVVLSETSQVRKAKYHRVSIASTDAKLMEEEGVQGELSGTAGMEELQEMYQRI